MTYLKRGATKDNDFASEATSQYPEQFRSSDLKARLCLPQIDYNDVVHLPSKCASSEVCMHFVFASNQLLAKLTQHLGSFIRHLNSGTVAATAAETHKL
jgi:hypothetical protein